MIRFKGIQSRDLKEGNKAILEICKEADVDVIELAWKNNLGKNTRQYYGFQGGVISLSVGMGGRDNGIKVEYDMNSDGKPDAMGRPTTFYPTGLSGRLVSYVFDTKFNRDLMTIDYYGGAPYKIITKSVESEIKAVAKKPSKVKSKKDSRIEELEAQLAAAKNGPTTELTIDSINKNTPEWRVAVDKFKKYSNENEIMFEKAKSSTKLKDEVNLLVLEFYKG